jgi:hypothetical protein
MTEPTLTAEEHPDSPSLSDWHTLYTTTRERFPECPCLGPKTHPQNFYGTVRLFKSTPVIVTDEPYPDSVCLMIWLDWAIRFGAWWADQTPEFDDDWTIRGGENRCQAIYNSEKRLWAAYSSRLVSPGTETHAKQVWEDYSEHPSHHAAYFAAVQAIGESNEKAKSRNAL